MRFIAVATALAFPLLAQETKPEEKPALPADSKPELAPQQKPPDLPPLPAPSKEKEDSDLLKVQPGARLKPDPERSNSLIPEGLSPAKKNENRPNVPPKGKSTLRPPTSSAELDTRIRYRQAQSRVVHDPAIQKLWDQSRTAQTDYEKREALKGYYTLLYRKMAALDNGIAKLVEERKRIALRRLDQTRIEPTDPLDQEHRQRQD